MVISSENFWNETQNALNVKELKDYSGTDYKGQKHNQYQNVKANNFLQFVTTEKIGREKFDFVLNIKSKNQQQQPKPQTQQNNNTDPEPQQSTTINHNKNEKKKSYLKPILIGCGGILAACLVSIPVIGPIIKQHIKNSKTKVNINK